MLVTVFLKWCSRRGESSVLTLPGGPFCAKSSTRRPQDGPPRFKRSSLAVVHFALFFYRFLRCPGASSEPGRGRSAARGLDLWCAVKTSHSEKTIAKHEGKHHFGKIAPTGAGRKGELLRGKVSQGRPHPLSIALKSDGQTLNKKRHS